MNFEQLLHLLKRFGQTNIFHYVFFKNRNDNMLTLVQIIYWKYAPESQHYWTNKLRQAWPVSIHCWVPVVKALCEQTQIARDKNH